MFETIVNKKYNNIILKYVIKNLKIVKSKSCFKIKHNKTRVIVFKLLLFIGLNTS
jgi:hypothetical protein